MRALAALAAACRARPLHQRLAQARPARRAGRCVPFLSLLPATARAAKPAPRPRWPPRLRPAAGDGAQARSARVRALVRALRLGAAEAGAEGVCEQGLDAGGGRPRGALAHLGAAGAVSALRSLSVLGASERFADEMEALVQARRRPPPVSLEGMARVCTARGAGQAAARCRAARCARGPQARDRGSAGAGAAPSGGRRASERVGGPAARGGRRAEPSSAQGADGHG